MNIKTISFFKYLGVLPESIDELCGICPEIFDFDSDWVIENILLVIAYGYPKDDIFDLLAQNYGFVFTPKEELKQKLDDIEGDVEEALKMNPFLI